MTQLEAKIIVGLAENNLDVSPTARKLYMHRNTIMYHLRLIQRETRKNPRDFYDMCDLLPMARQVLALGVDERTMKALETMGERVHGGGDNADA